MVLADLITEINGEDGRNEAELRIAATHEAGHAVAALALGLECEGLSLRAVNGRGGGMLSPVRTGYLSAADVSDRLTMLMAGRAAEEVVLGKATSGAGGSIDSDLGAATMMAARSVAEFGLDSDHGLTWTPLPERPAGFARWLADHPRLAALVHDRLASAYAAAVTLLEGRRDLVEALADTLLARGAMDGGEAARVIRAGRKAVVRCAP